MQPIKCILIDDELPMLAYLQTLCRQIAGVQVVKSYHNPIRFLEEADGLDFNTCVIDINMPGMNGLQLANQLQNRAIIFSTAYKEYAAEAFDVDAVDYLRKPYQLVRLEKAFIKAADWLSVKKNSVQRYLVLNTSRGRARIRTDELAFATVAENDRRDKNLVLKDGRDLLAKNITFDQLLDQLPEREFCRINRKALIALATVTGYTEQWVYCTLPHAEKPVPFALSDPYRDSFKQKLMR